MSNNPQICPYLLRVKRQLITCEGVEDGCQINQGFSGTADCSAHYSRYCSGEYHRCHVATLLNRIYRRYDDSPCPNNAGVECLHKDGCARCGWNPEVAQQRLQAFLSQFSMQPGRADTEQNPIKTTSKM